MVQGVVEINGLPYAIIPFQQERQGREADVHTRTKESFSPNFRTQGNVRLDQIQGATRQIFGPFTGGHGRKKILTSDVDLENEFKKFWDTNGVDTRWPDGARLPLLKQTPTDTGDTDMVFFNSLQEFGNLLILYGARELADINNDTIKSMTWDGATTDFDTVQTVQAPSTQALILTSVVSPDQVIVFYAVGASPTVFAELSTDGTTPSWTQLTWSSAPTLTGHTISANTSVSEQFQIVKALFSLETDEFVIVTVDSATDLIEFWSNTSAGTTIAIESPTIPLTTVSLNTTALVNGLAEYTNEDGNSRVYLGTRESLYEIDHTSSTWTKKRYFTTTPGFYNFRNMITHDGKLFFPLHAESDEPARLVALDTSGGNRDYTFDWGLDIGDTVPVDALGPISYLLSRPPWLIMAVGGTAASRNARIMMRNTSDPDAGWHTIYKHATSNERIHHLFVTNLDDDVERLFFISRKLSGGAGVDSSQEDNIFFMEDVFVNPASGLSIKREASGFIDLPNFNMGMPTLNKNVLQNSLEAEDLSASTSGQYVAASFGLNGQVRTTITLGDYLSGDLDLDLGGTAGEGAILKSYATRLTLHRGGTNTLTPVVQSLDVAYLPDPPEQQIFSVMVDIAASAKMSGSGDRKVVVDNLKSAAAAGGILKLFKYTDNSHFVRVKLQPMERMEPGFGGGVSPDTLAATHGFVLVTMEEMI